jgi:hypothetical protein
MGFQGVNESGRPTQTEQFQHVSWLGRNIDIRLAETEYYILTARKYSGFLLACKQFLLLVLLAQ